MPSLTPHYSFYKPLVADAIDEDLWGGYLNDNFDSLDTLVYNGTRLITNTKTSAFILDASYNNEIILADATSGAFNITLQSAATAGDGYTVAIKKVNTNANAITIVGTIDGVVNYTLSEGYINLVSNGVSWYAAARPYTSTIPAQLVQAVGVFDSNGGSVSGFAYQNGMASVVRNSTGVYTLTLSAPMASVEYVVNCSGYRASGSGDVVWTVQTVSTTVFTIKSTTVSSTPTDAKVHFSVFGNRP